MKIAAVIAVCLCLLCGGVAFADEPIVPSTIESTFSVTNFAAVQSDLEQLLFSEQNRIEGCGYTWDASPWSTVQQPVLWVRTSPAVMDTLKVDPRFTWIEDLPGQVTQ
ncbi:MAG: hypothetical protein AAGU11_09120 [Syntrophobacteraceae bacterium]